MDSTFITKQILPNKLRLIMTPRTGEEPDPPQIDFSSNGRGIIDTTNIDFKFPSEHTVCGHRFDGEMQYFTYHPARKRFVAVSFFLDGENIVLLHEKNKERAVCNIILRHVSYIISFPKHLFLVVVMGL